MRTARSTADPALAREVWRLWVRLLTGHNRSRFHQVAASTGLSIPQSHALMELHPDSHAASMRHLAACLRSDPSNITGLVDRLEAKGLVERRPDPSDRRVKAIVLTEAGRQARAELRRIVEEPPPAFARLSPDRLRLMRELLADIGEPE